MMLEFLHLNLNFTYLFIKSNVVTDILSDFFLLLPYLYLINYKIIFLQLDYIGNEIDTLLFDVHFITT